MAFDPFGDFEQAGYLRNLLAIKSQRHIKAMEHQAFLVSLPSCMVWLSRQDVLGYEQLLEVHRLLFCGVYPWAGKDRLELASTKNVRKGDTEFANPQDMRRAFIAGNSAKSHGQVLGYWAYAHPFLECNGRALFVSFCFLSE